MAGEQAAAAAASKGTIAFSYGNESAGIYPIVADPARIKAERRGYDGSKARPTETARRRSRT